MNDTTLTHKDLAALLGVSETTVKSYRRKFPGCIPVANRGKPIRFSPEAAAVATRIRDHFETGMSVEDIRARLADEFSWIAAEPAEGITIVPAKAARDTSASVPALAKNVSNMARSLVSLTQQQNVILSRMEAFEALLAEKSGPAPHAAPGPDGEIEARLDQLDAHTRDLAHSVATLTRRLDRFLDGRDKAAEEWPEQSAQTLAAAASIAAQTLPPDGAPPREQAEPPVAEAPLPSPPLPDVPPPAPEDAAPESPSMPRDEEPDQGPSVGAAAQDERAQVIPFQERPQPDLVPAQPEPATQAAEPPRHFFSLPLMVCTEDGHYQSAGGKSRGRFCLNDLKAMLIYGFTPPNHFTLRWEKHGQGWWLHLEQETTDRQYRLLLMELPSHKGGQVAEILQLKRGAQALHPVEIWGIIDSFAE